MTCNFIAFSLWCNFCKWYQLSSNVIKARLASSHQYLLFSYNRACFEFDAHGFNCLMEELSPAFPSKKVRLRGICWHDAIEIFWQLVQQMPFKKKRRKRWGSGWMMGLVTGYWAFCLWVCHSNPPWVRSAHQSPAIAGTLGLRGLGWAGRCPQHYMWH